MSEELIFSMVKEQVKDSCKTRTRREIKRKYTQRKGDSGRFQYVN